MNHTTAASMVDFVLDTIDAIPPGYSIEWLSNYIYTHQSGGFWTREEVNGFIAVAHSQI